MDKGKIKEIKQELRCPCCDKEAVRSSTKVSGRFTSRCARCKNIIVWDFDCMTAALWKQVG